MIGVAVCIEATPTTLSLQRVARFSSEVDHFWVAHQRRAILIATSRKRSSGPPDPFLVNSSSPLRARRQFDSAGLAALAISANEPRHRTPHEPARKRS